MPPESLYSITPPTSTNPDSLIPRRLASRREYDLSREPRSSSPCPYHTSEELTTRAWCSGTGLSVCDYATSHALDPHALVSRHGLVLGYDSSRIHTLHRVHKAGAEILVPLPLRRTPCDARQLSGPQQSTDLSRVRRIGRADQRRDVVFWTAARVCWMLARSHSRAALCVDPWGGLGCGVRR